MGLLFLSCSDSGTSPDETLTLLWQAVAPGVLHTCGRTTTGGGPADDVNAAMESLGKPPMEGAAVGLYVVLDFLYGIALVWTYAAIRPRFGAGARTAVYAGLLLWVLIGLLYAVGEMPMSVFPTGLMVWGTLAGMILQPLAPVAGAKIYTEA